MDLAVDVRFPHPPGDQLGVLRSEVDDQDAVVMCWHGYGRLTLGQPDPERREGEGAGATSDSLHCSWSDSLSVEQARHLFPRSRHPPLAVIGNDLRRSWPAVVVRSHDEPVCSGPEHGQRVSGLQPGEHSVQCEEITGLAHRANHIRPTGRPSVLDQLHDLVVGLIVAGPDQVVHAGIDHHELLPTGMLAVEHPGEQDTGASHQETAGLEIHREAGGREQWHDRGGELPGSIERSSA